MVGPKHQVEGDLACGQGEREIKKGGVDEEEID
jgi:hypothetical protein